MLLSTVLCFVCVAPALLGRTKPALAAEGEHPAVAHPLWAHLWRRRRVPPEPAGV